ncbi:MAG: hypothetical protein ACHQF3_08585 [Alphaproteobacteria bacterium]
MSIDGLLAPLIAALASVPLTGRYLAYLPQALAVALAVIGCASAVAAVVPHPARLDGWLGKARTLLNWLALNVGQAKPAAAQSHS